jgi:peptidase E
MKMNINLHLLSTPGEGDIRYILQACRPYLEAQSSPLVAYLPWAAVGNNWLEYTRQAFAGLAEVGYLDYPTTSLIEAEQIMKQAGAIYISGGNTYLLNHRLHESGLFEHLRRHAEEGLPVVGFSAGALICGANILTTHDINMIPTTHFTALELLPYNIVAHYPGDETAQTKEDDWLSDYHVLHDKPILALEDGATVWYTRDRLQVLGGNVWQIEKGKKRMRCNSKK